MTLFAKNTHTKDYAAPRRAASAVASARRQLAKAPLPKEALAKVERLAVVPKKVRRASSGAKAGAVLGIAGVAGVAAYLAVRHWRSGHEGQTLPVVADVDLARYAGTWYEQARLPNRFQRNCGGQVSAHYSVRADGTVGVLNRCVGRDGHVEAVQGVAKRMPVAGVSSPGRLAVRFASAWLSWLPPVWGEYWVIQLDENYQYALVGTPDRRFLWILSRRPRLQESKAVSYTHLTLPTIYSV